MTAIAFDTDQGCVQNRHHESARVEAKVSRTADILNMFMTWRQGLMQSEMVRSEFADDKCRAVKRTCVWKVTIFRDNEHA